MSDSQRSDYASRTDYSGDSSGSGGGASSYFGGGYTGEGFNGLGATTPATGYDFGGWSSSGGVNTTPTVDDSTSQSYSPISDAARQASIANHMAATSKPGEAEYSQSLAERVRDKFTPTSGSYFHTMGVRAPGTSFDEMSANETEKQRNARLQGVGDIVNKFGVAALNSNPVGRAAYSMAKNVDAYQRDKQTGAQAIGNFTKDMTFGSLAGMANKAVAGAIGPEVSRALGTYNQYASIGNTLGLTNLPGLNPGAAIVGAGFKAAGIGSTPQARNATTGAGITTPDGMPVPSGSAGWTTGGSTGGWSSSGGRVPLEVEIPETPAPKPASDYTSMRVDLDLQGWAQKVRANSQRKRTGG